MFILRHIAAAFLTLVIMIAAVILFITASWALAYTFVTTREA